MDQQESARLVAAVEGIVITLGQAVTTLTSEQEALRAEIVHLTNAVRRLSNAGEAIERELHAPANAKANLADKGGSKIMLNARIAELEGTLNRVRSVMQRCHERRAAAYGNAEDFGEVESWLKEALDA